MSQRLRSQTWLWPGAALAMVVLTLGVSLCFFDGDGSGTDDHDIVRDLCGGLLVSVLSVILLPLTALSPVLAETLHPVHAVSLHRLDPPPKSSRLS